MMGKIGSKRLYFLTALMFLSIQLAMGEQGKFSLGSGFDYSTGKYGGATSTDVTYIPVTGKYETRDWLFKLTVPYIRISGPGNITPNIGQNVYLTNAVRTDEGLGDIVAAASYGIINSAASGIAVDVTEKIKFGTANKTVGLGTGVNDYATEISAYIVKGQIGAFGTVGYKVYGQSLGYTLNNAFYGSIGMSYKFDEKTSAGVSYDYRNQTSSLADPQKLWTWFVNRKINSIWKTQAYLFTGSGNSSPSIGGGATLTRVF